MSLGITTKSFSLQIEELVKTKNLSYMDAVIYYCDQKDIEPERITRFIDKGMKEMSESIKEKGGESYSKG